MGFKRQLQVLRPHPAAIVGHPHQACAALLKLDQDLAGAGVQGVLHQLLDYRSWALDNLTGCDLVAHHLGQEGDAT